MNENENKPGEWKKIVGAIVLIIALFVCIKFIFWGLGQAVPPEKLRGRPDVSVSQSVPAGGSGDVDAPSFCIHCGKGLPESFQWGQFCPYCGEKIEQ